MINYCETDKCLRQFILSYFGDTTPCVCNKCSNCVVVGDDEEEKLYTRRKSAQKALQLSGLSAVGQELFEKLRICRMKLASEKIGSTIHNLFRQDIKGYVCEVSGNKKKKMTEVYGMGEQKIKNYGDVFYRGDK